MKWSACWGNVVFLIEGALKYKFVACLICLLLLVAAVDTIPDPPAISPPSGHSSGVSALHVRGPLTLLEKEWFCAWNSPRRTQIVFFSISVAFDNEPLDICPLPLVYHATDASPPDFS